MLLRFFDCERGEILEWSGGCWWGDLILDVVGDRLNLVIFRFLNEFIVVGELFNVWGNLVCGDSGLFLWDNWLSFCFFL